MKNFIFFITVAILLSCKDRSPKNFESIDMAHTQETALEESMERGSMLYMDFCLQCHMAQGEGVPGSFPPLAGSDWLTDKRTESIHSVKFGQQGEIVVNGESYNGVMVPMGLSDEEVADVLNFVMNSWGNTQEKMITPEEVAAVEK